MKKSKTFLVITLLILTLLSVNLSLGQVNCPKGDINGDCQIGLEDVINALQILSKFSNPKSPLNIVELGRYKTGAEFDDGGTEISKYDIDSKRLFSTNGAEKVVDIIDLSNPNNPQKIGSIDLSNDWDSFGGLNSVAVKNGIVVVAAENDNKGQKGMAMFYNTNGIFQTKIEVGVLPDMVLFSPDGNKVVIANEAEPYVDSNNIIRDPEGSISIINLSKNNLANSTKMDVYFGGITDNKNTCLRTALQSSENEAIHEDDRNIHHDFEPEYITISEDSTTAYVSLQENNGIAVVDIINGVLISVNGLGYKDHSMAGYGLDAKEDGKGFIEPVNLRSLYMPDTIGSFLGKDGKTYILTANEGDSRELEDNDDKLLYADNSDDTKNNTIEDITVSSINKSDFPDINFLIDQGLTGTLTYDYLYLIGARSFSIWNSDNFSVPVFDSGNDFERIMLDKFPQYFNAADDDNDIDSRSPKSGPEPEALVIGKIGDKVLAFIGLEKFGGIMVYDVTVPVRAKFLNYISNRNFNVDPDDLKDDSSLDPTSAGDLGAEGMVFIPEKDSPNGKNLLVVCNEISGTITIYSIDY